MLRYEADDAAWMGVSVDAELDTAPRGFDTIAEELNGIDGQSLARADVKALTVVAENLELDARRLGVVTMANADIVTGDHSMSAAELTATDLAILQDDGFAPRGSSTSGVRSTIPESENPYGYYDF